MNLEIGTVAAQLIFWEYINRNLFAVYLKAIIFNSNLIKLNFVVGRPDTSCFVQYENLHGTYMYWDEQYAT